MYRSPNFKVSKSKQIIVFMLMLVISGGVFAAQGNFAQRPTYAPGEILVKFKEGVSEVKKMSLRSDRIEEQHGSIRKASLKKTVTPSDIEHWKLGEGESVPEKIAELQQNEDILFAEPNYYMYKMAQPNDEYYYKQWGLDSIDWLDVWEKVPKPDCSNVIVAVIDDGVQISHPDLEGNIVSGYDVLREVDDASPHREFFSHGTEIAGVLGAVGNNEGEGIIGVAWDVKIMPILFNGIKPDGTPPNTLDAKAAFEWALENDAHIINYSYGAMGVGETLKGVIDRLEQKNILLVVSAGNGDVNNELVPLYPASLDNKNIISVAASNQADYLTSWSQYGFSSVDVMAPGENIYTTTTGSDYIDGVSGTSFSAPYVAGVAALIKSQDPEVGFQEMKGRIMASVDVNAVADVTAQDKVASGGRVNALNALDIEETPVLVIKSVTVDDSGNGVIDPNEQTDLVVEIENVWVDAADVSARLINMDEDFITIIDPDASIEVIRKGESEQAIFNIRYTNAAEYKKIPFGLEITANGGEYSVTRYFNLVTGYLENDVVTNGTIQTDDYDDVHYYHFNVPANAKRLEIRTTSSANIDLFAMKGWRPPVSYLSQRDFSEPGIERYYFIDEYSDFEYSVDENESGNESIIIDNPEAGDYFVSIYSFEETSNNQYTIYRNLELYPDGDTGDDTDSGSGGGGSVPLQLLILLGGIALCSRNRNSLS